MPNEKVIVAVENTYEAISLTIDSSSLRLKAENIYFIKISDLEEWTRNSKVFTAKLFGDKTSNLVINFIYKDGGEDLRAEKLESEIKMALLSKALEK